MQAANTKHLHNIYTTSAQRYVGSTLYQCYTIVLCLLGRYHEPQGGGPRVVVSTAAGVRFPVSAVWKKQKMFLSHPRVKVSIVGSLRDREVECSASDRQGSNFESCVWRTVSSQSSHHPQEVLLAQFSLYVHRGGLKPDSFHFFTTSHNFKWVTIQIRDSSGWRARHPRRCTTGIFYTKYISFQFFYFI